jgi:anti-sigma-K factor RskA
MVQVVAPQPLDTYSALGITIEPAGGSPAPTGPKVLGS